MGKFDQWQQDTRTQIKNRFELLALIQAASDVFGPDPQNVVQAIEQFDWDRVLANDDPDGGVWFDNDQIQILQDHLLELTGMNLIELEIRQTERFENRFFASVTNIGEKFLFGFYDDVVMLERAVPASDRRVRRGDNRESWDQAIRSLEEVIQSFKADHRLDNELGAEKPALLDILSGARQLLEQYEIGARLAIGVLVRPLERLLEIATKYPEATWAVSANAALSAVLHLLGLG